ncbi:hypothetical protein [Catenulispora rubra]|uniref:hypothetical protein n=1 Tax=Catenulispora rubra TaxID=280293 RepID=UPI00189285D0|nr:hypothetical protein [Catenulispora rubra]
MGVSNRTAETSCEPLRRKALSELVGGFTRHEFVFVLNESPETPPRFPVRGESPEATAVLLETAVDGFIALGADRLQKMVAIYNFHCEQAAEAARRDDMPSFWWWIHQSEAMTGGNGRTGHLLDLADALVHHRERRDGLCARPCCDRQWWTKRGFPRPDMPPENHRANYTGRDAVPAPDLPD